MCKATTTPLVDNTTSTATATMPVAAKKGVTFGEIQQHFLAPVPEDLQRQFMYYSAEELSIQKEADISLLRINSDNINTEASLLEHGICFRGLEQTYNTNDKTERRDRIRKYIRTVLEVHLEQKELGYRDDYEVYIVARANSKTDRKKAQRLAAQDAEDVLVLVEKDCLSHHTNTKRRRRSLKRLLSGSMARVFTSSKRNLLRSNSLSSKNLSLKNLDTNSRTSTRNLLRRTLTL